MRRLGLLGLALALSAAGTGVGVVSASAATTDTLGEGTVLLLDVHRMEFTSGLQRQYLQGRKTSLSGRPLGQLDVKRVRTYRGTDDAADGDVDVDTSPLLDATTVMREGSLYRMWLRSGTNIGYRESSDGLHWHIHSPDTVILVRNVNSGSVVKDPVSGLYFLIGWSKARGHYVEMSSRDGLSFTPTGLFSGALSLLAGDVISGFADDDTGSLVAVAKQKTLGGQRCPKAGSRTFSGGRTFGVNESPSSQARYWNTPRVVLTADCTDEYSVAPTPGTIRPVQLYGASFQRYGDQYLAFPWIFHITTPPVSVAKSGWADGPVDTQIASTPNATRTTWTRPAATVRSGSRLARPVAIVRGPAGSWDDGMVYGISLLAGDDDTSRLYYNGWDTEHTPRPGRQVGVGMVTWPRDRFMALRSGTRPGVLRTKAFHLAANAADRDLHVNAAMGTGQTLRVAVLDARTNRPLPGYQLTDSTVVGGSTLDTTVTWNGRNLGRLSSRAIKLLFRYTGSLYSFRVS